MNMERIKELKESYENALSRLREALSEEISKNPLAVDGTIQRFEFTFELAWKLAKAILERGGVQLKTIYPRSIIKETFAAGIITDEMGWLKMLDDRNETSHIYNEEHALKIYERIKNNGLAQTKDLDWSTIADRYIDVYEEIIKRKKR